MALLEFNVLTYSCVLDQIEIITVLLDITECSIVLERLKVPIFWQAPSPEGHREEAMQFCRIAKEAGGLDSNQVHHLITELEAEATERNCSDGGYVST